MEWWEHEEERRGRRHPQYATHVLWGTLPRNLDDAIEDAVVKRLRGDPPAPLPESQYRPITAFRFDHAFYLCEVALVGRPQEGRFYPYMHAQWKHDITGLVWDFTTENPEMRGLQTSFKLVYGSESLQRFADPGEVYATVYQQEYKRYEKAVKEAYGTARQPLNETGPRQPFMIGCERTLSIYALIPLSWEAAAAWKVGFVLTGVEVV